MTREERCLLLKDLCGRLPYGVKMTDGVDIYRLTSPFLYRYIEMELKPYLRPMSSMTEEEKEEFDKLVNLVEERCINAYGKGGYSLAFTELNDWLNKNMFDYRGLIPMGLALEAPKGIYKIE